MNQRTLSTSHTYTLGLHLVAKTAFILPQCCGDPWFRAGRRDLARGIINETLQWRSSAIAIARRSYNRVVVQRAH